MRSWPRSARVSLSSQNALRPVRSADFGADIDADIHADIDADIDADCCAVGPEIPSRPLCLIY